VPPDIELAAARPEITREQTHLDESRAVLHRMRERTAAMTALAGDRVSGEYLKFTLWKRMKALEDDPEVPLFFGRLDYTNAERFYIGRRHVTDEAGDPLVVDWRAPISRPFYRASRTESLGVRLRRRFGFQHGALTAYEDEALGESGPVAPVSEAEPTMRSELLEAEIERPRSGPMRDIVATIQPEQDEIVRAELAESIFVQGGPGTGKTAVGLHRAAYLLYAYGGQLKRGGVLVVGPNDAFIHYIAQVLPALGEIDVEQKPLDEVLASVSVRGRDGEEAAAVKHDPRMADVIRRAIESRRAPVAGPLVVELGMGRLRISPSDLARIRERVVHRSLPYEAGRRMLREALIERLLGQAEHRMPGVSRGEVAKALRDSKPAQAALAALWPRVNPVDVVFGLLSDGDALARASEGILGDDERRLLLWDRKVSKARAPWSAADLVLLDEAAGFVARPHVYGHVIVDEAQDLSPMQLRAIGRRFDRSVTLLGDLAQATTLWASRNWEDVLTHMGVREARMETLSRAFRIPGSVLALANRLLRYTAPELPPAVAVRDATDALSVVEVPPERVAEEIAAEVAHSLDRPGSIGVIVSGDEIDRVGRALGDRGVRWGDVEGVALGERVTVIRPEEAKGLEFDVVVLAEPGRIATGDPRSLRLLYIAMTRAVLRLVIVHAAPLPIELAA
jgi:DNA helicase IV